MHMATKTQLPQVTHLRNQAMQLDLDWVTSVQANTSAIEHRAATLGGRRSVKNEFQAAWLLKAISLIDLTTLSGDDTEGRVKRLCAKARQPVAPAMLEKLGMPGLTTGAVCVYHEMVETAVKNRIGAVAAYAFPGRCELLRCKPGGEFWRDSFRARH